jgi:hypothetical protein
MSCQNIYGEKCYVKLCKNYKLCNENVCHIHKQKEDFYMFLISVIVIITCSLILTYFNQDLNQLFDVNTIYLM